MAKHLDLEEQEQLDQLKHFWKQYGNLITWALVAVLGAFAAWNGYQYWQKRQASHAAAVFDEVVKLANAGLLEKAQGAAADMREKFTASSYTQQAELFVAKAFVDAGKLDAAKASLQWVSDKSRVPGYASIARLRLAAVLLDQKAFEDALNVLNSVNDAAFFGLRADRRGDVYMAMGKKAEAKEEYLTAVKEFDERTDYRRLVAVKLNALGVDPKLDGVGQ